MKRFLSIAAVTAVFVSIASGVAFGAPRYDTKLSIGYSRQSGSFSGGVKSKHAKCVPGRRVTVYRQQGGHDPSVGSDSSSANGRWRVNPPGHVATGNYYAKTASVHLASNGGTCRAATSVATHAS